METTAKLNSKLMLLQRQLEGELLWDSLHKKLYATDASVYKMEPLAVAFPKNETDLKALIVFAQEYQLSLIPRTAGTSLAGQCVGTGIVVDVSKYFTKILDLDTEKKTVTVQPGVNRDALNIYLAEKGLFFGPNTSTSKYCMLGGMVGNNSSGTTSIRYGVTRDKVVRMETLLSDGSKAIFEECDQNLLQQKLEQDSLEASIYKMFLEELSDKKVQSHIINDFPHASVHRRNTGYAVDKLLEQQPFQPKGSGLNLSKLLAGSEGTLAFTTAITLDLEPLPPQHSVMLVLRFDSIKNAMQAVVPVM